jgi:hypothetical protein
MDDDDFEDEALLPVEDFQTEELAKAAGAELVSNGVGAAVEPIPAAEIEDGGFREGYRVLVLEHELHRAQEILGLVELSDRPPANPEEVMKPLPKQTNWKLVLLIWFAALILIPIGAFWLSYVIFSR